MCMFAGTQAPPPTPHLAHTTPPPRRTCGTQGRPTTWVRGWLYQVNTRRGGKLIHAWFPGPLIVLSRHYSFKKCGKLLVLFKISKYSVLSHWGDGRLVVTDKMPCVLFTYMLISAGSGLRAPESIFRTPTSKIVKLKKQTALLLNNTLFRNLLLNESISRNTTLSR